MSKQRIKEIESELEVLSTKLDEPIDWSSKYNPSVLKHEQVLQECVKLRNELDGLRAKEN